MASWPTPGVHRHMVGADAWDVYIYGQDGRSRLGRAEKSDQDGIWRVTLISNTVRNSNGQPTEIPLRYTFPGVNAATNFLARYGDDDASWRLENFEARNR